MTIGIITTIAIIAAITIMETFAIITTIGKSSYLYPNYQRYG